MDAEKIYAKLSPQGTCGDNAFEHKIFDGDEESRPLISQHNGKRAFYYSFWLVDLPKKQKAALDAFRAGIERKAGCHQIATGRCFSGYSAWQAYKFVIVQALEFVIGGYRRAGSGKCRRRKEEFNQSEQFFHCYNFCQ